MEANVELRMKKQLNSKFLIPSAFCLSILTRCVVNLLHYQDGENILDHNS